jgi:chemotaxis protein histidine kinase CheA
VAAGQETCEQLGQQLAAVTAQLQQEQAEKQEVLSQLQEAKEAYAGLQAQHQQLLSSAGSEAAAASAELAQLKASMQQLQDAHGALQQEHAAALASVTSSQEHQQQLQQQLSQAQQQLSELQAAHAALQAAHAMQGQQLQDTQQALAALQEAHAKQDAELSTAQRQLSSLQDSHATALQQQESLQAHLSSTQAELGAMQAAAAAAATKRAGMPHKHTQVAATDHADAHWVANRGVQTGAELDPKSTKDAGTPADLSLLSYFFREVKQKQRGGGGAILCYDPAEAAAVATASQGGFLPAHLCRHHNSACACTCFVSDAHGTAWQVDPASSFKQANVHAACVGRPPWCCLLPVPVFWGSGTGPPSQYAKSWSGGTGLPPISASSPGARDSKSAAARSSSPAPQKRPATMPGSLRANKAADDE